MTGWGLKEVTEDDVRWTTLVASRTQNKFMICRLLPLIRKASSIRYSIIKCQVISINNVDLTFVVREAFEFYLEFTKLEALISGKGKGVR